MERKLFGTDGIRGKANIFPMTCEVAFALGRAVTNYFQQKNSRKNPMVIIGKDTRLSCYMLEQAFSAGVCSQGGQAILTGPLPTPGVAFAVQSMRADAGVMISASHNAFYDNGIKIFDRTGHKLPDSTEKILEEMVLSPEKLPTMLGADLGRAKRLDEILGRYIVQVKSVFDKKYSLEGLKIVVDGANGAGYKVAPLVFEELGAEVISLGDHPNGQNINEGCGAIHPETCAQEVLKQKADIGICIDGDGDRVVIINDQGQVIHGDHLIGICARFLKDQGELKDQDEVVGTVMTNLGLEKYLKSLNLNLYRTKVGDRYIVERLTESNSFFGGEPSGHIIFKKYSTTGDGLLAALKILEALLYYKKSLVELTSDIPLCPHLLTAIKVKKREDLAQQINIQQAITSWEKKLADKGRILLRYSGTEPLLRLLVEGEDANLIKKASQELSEIIQADLG
ncbi:MAG: phosphoglucosamine mutase [Bacteriovoracaceae bacterium]|nr:phosphoglucosamine mutase [Bacteriovoracaceae bacterium]